jgi:hypothetical protein
LWNNIVWRFNNFCWNIIRDRWFKTLLFKYSIFFISNSVIGKFNSSSSVIKAIWISSQCEDTFSIMNLLAKVYIEDAPHMRICWLLNTGQNFVNIHCRNVIRYNLLYVPKMFLNSKFYYFHVYMLSRCYFALAITFHEQAKSNRACNIFNFAVWDIL